MPRFTQSIRILRVLAAFVGLEFFSRFGGGKAMYGGLLGATGMLFIPCWTPTGILLMPCCTPNLGVPSVGTVITFFKFMALGVSTEF